MDPNSAAFPQHGYSDNPIVVERMSTRQGLTVRAYIATEAMNGLLSGQFSTTEPGELARDAVEIADALIAELNK